MSVIRIGVALLIMATLVYVGRQVWAAGYEHGRNECLEQQAQADAERARAASAQAGQQHAASKASAEIAREREVITRVQVQEVIRYVQSRATPDCRLDADGMRLWRAANAGADPVAAAAAAAPHRPVPGDAAATALAGAGGPGHQPRGHHADLLPMQATAPGAGGLAREQR